MNAKKRIINHLKVFLPLLAFTALMLDYHRVMLYFVLIDWVSMALLLCFSQRTKLNRLEYIIPVYSVLSAFLISAPK